MLDFTIINAGVYRHAQTARWTAPLPSLGLYVQGLKWRRDATGLHQSFMPALLLRPAGEPTEYCYGSNRENWVILLKTDTITAAQSPEMVSLRLGESQITVPRMTPLPPPGIAYYQSLFAQISEDIRDPSPIAQLTACGKVMSAISHILDHHRGSQVRSLAGQLKRLIDEDEAWTRSIEEMSRTCGFSVDHMRLQFEREFGLNPHAYRHRRRLQIAMQLLENTLLPLKDIAARLGFRHMSHLCMSYRKAFGVSPGATRRPTHGERRES